MLASLKHIIKDVFMLLTHIKTLLTAFCLAFLSTAHAEVPTCGNHVAENIRADLSWFQALSFESEKVRLPIATTPAVLGKVCIGLESDGFIGMIVYRDNQGNISYGPLSSFNLGMKLMDRERFPFFLRGFIRKEPLVKVKTSIIDQDSIHINVEVVTNVTAPQRQPTEKIDFDLTLDNYNSPQRVTTYLNAPIEKIAIEIKQNGFIFSTNFSISQIKFTRRGRLVERLIID